MLTGTITLAAGVDVPLVLVMDNCSLKFDVMGAQAQLRPNQTCPPRMIDASGVPATETDSYNAGAIILTEDTASLSESGTVTVFVPSASAIPCTFTVTATLTRVGP